MSLPLTPDPATLMLREHLREAVDILLSAENIARMRLDENAMALPRDMVKALQTIVAGLRMLDYAVGKAVQAEVYGDDINS